MKKIFSIFAALFFAGSIFAAETRILSNKNIYDAGDAASGYQAWSVTDDQGDVWNANAIKGKHSNATADKHYLQIKKYASNTAYYIQVPELGTKITTIEVTVSNTQKAMDGGGNTQTLFFSASNETSAAGTGVVSGTGDASVTLDCSDLDLNTGYITAGGAVRIWEVVVTYETTVPDVAKPTITPAANPFVGSTSVTLACETAGATIYYTTNGDDPDDSSEEYDGTPFSIDATTTVKAIAYDGTNWSAIATKEITGLTVLTTMDEIFEAAGATASPQYIAFNDWIVTGVSSNGKNVFVTDGTKGFVINDGSGAMGFKANDVLSGTVQVNLQKYKGYAQVTGLKASTTGLTVDEGGVPTLNVLDADGIAALTGVNTGSLIQIKGAYSTSSSKHYVAGVQIYNSICGSYPDFEEADYTVTGVYQQFDAVKEILPRALADIEEDVAGGAIKADDIALGEIFVVDDNPYETFIGLVVTGINLTEDIVASTSSEGLTIVSQTLNKDGGSVEVNIQAPLGVFEGTISLTSGDLIKPVKVTATVRKKNIEPAIAVDPIVDPSKGTNASEATVIIDDTGDEYDGVKIGKSGENGDALIVVGAGAEKLYFYALAWNGAAGTIQLSAEGISIWAPEMDADGKIALMASAGIKNSSPFTVDDIAVENLYQCLYEITLTGVTAQTAIKVSSGTAQRFVLFGIKQVGGETPTALEDVTVENTAVKQIINNQVVITRDGVRYNVIGQIVK